MSLNFGRINPSDGMSQNLAHGASVVSLVLIFTVSGWAAESPSSSAPLTSTQPDSAEIARSRSERIKEQLQAQLPIAAATIEVRANDGEVILDGWVDGYPKREIAQEITGSISGVTNVKNQIAVRPVVKRTDKQIAENVRSTLQRDPATRSMKIDVTVNDGVVELEGEVATEPQRRFVGWKASRLLGVRDVRNELEVKPVQRDDQSIRQELQEHYSSSPVFNENQITIQVSDGVAKLSGTVDNLLEKTWAQNDAWIAGVSEVDVSGLRIQFGPEGHRQAPTRIDGVSDEQIQKLIERQYAYDPRVYSSKIEVEVDNGTVTVAGTVNYRSAERAALEIARHVVGVRNVVDQLAVQPPTASSDHEIASAVDAALTEESAVNAESIDVKASGGAVVLTGTVADPLAKWTAEDVANSTAGVIAVDNQLQIADAAFNETPSYYFPRGFAFRPWFPAGATRRPDTDTALTTAVRTRLAWSPYTDLNRIEVRGENGTVTLTGEVDTWTAREVAEDHARQAGAQTVKNNLRVLGASE